MSGCASRNDRWEWALLAMTGGRRISPSPQPSPIEGEGEGAGFYIDGQDERDFGRGGGGDCHVVRQAHHERLRSSQWQGGGEFHPHPNPLPSRERGKGRVFTSMDRMNGILGRGRGGDCHVVRQAHHERLRSSQWQIKTGTRERCLPWSWPAKTANERMMMVSDDDGELQIYCAGPRLVSTRTYGACYASCGGIPGARALIGRCGMISRDSHP